MDSAERATEIGISVQQEPHPSRREEWGTRYLAALLLSRRGMLMGRAPPTRGARQIHRSNDREEQPTVPSAETVGEYKHNHRQRDKKDAENESHLARFCLPFAGAITV